MTELDEESQRYREQYQQLTRALVYRETGDPSLSWRELLRPRRALGWSVSVLERWAVGRLLRRIPSPETLRVLDSPCGFGKLTTILPEPAQVTGLDASRVMLEFYREVGGVDPIQGDLTALPICDNAVDLVICNRFLHRLPASVRHRILTELHRVSRRWAIVYYGVQGAFVKAVQALEQAIGLGDRGVHFPLHYHGTLTELLEARWKVVTDTPVLRGVSTGYVFLVKKG